MARQRELVPMVDWIYDLFLWTFSILVDLFFREVHPRGAWKVPRRGSVIFVAAPHANQVRNPSKGVTLTRSRACAETRVTVCGPPDLDAGHPNGGTSAHSLPHRGEIHAEEVHWNVCKIGRSRTCGEGHGQGEACDGEDILG